MTPFEFQNYLHEHIPITAAMDFYVSEYSNQTIRIDASIGPNINHRESAFGGSISSLLIITAWARVFQILKEYHETGTIVIQSSHVNFLQPVTYDFEALAGPVPDEILQKFLKMYAKFGKARINIQTEITRDQEKLAEFSGQFVVIKH